jgi:hypothetical protein
MVEVLALYNGSNNGCLALSARTAAERCRCSKDTASRALRELQQTGFIEVSVAGTWHRRLATEWRVTLYNCDRNGALASKAFMRIKPSNPAVPKFFRGPTTGIAGPLPGTRQPQKQPQDVLRSEGKDHQREIATDHGPVSGTHIVYHRE